MRARLLPPVAALSLVMAACSADPGFTVGPVEFASPPGALAPHLARLADGVALTYLERTGGDSVALRVVVRRGDAWHAAGTAVHNDSLFANWADIPSLLVLPDGRWLAHWLQKTAPSAYAYHVKLALSADGGGSWGEPFRPHGDRSDTEHGFVAMTPWRGGAALVWLDGRNTGGEGDASGGERAGGAMTIRFTTLAPDGAVAPDDVIDDRVCDCCQTDLAATATGLVAVYRDRSDDDIRDIAAVRWQDDRWTAPTPVGGDGWYYPGCPVNGPAVAARGDTVVVAWFTAAHDTARTQAAISVDGGATFGPAVRTDDGRPAGRVDAAFLFDGTPVVSWIEQVGEGGEIRVRPLALDGRLGASTTVARTTAARAAGFPRLIAVGQGLVAAWTDPESTRVKVVTIRLGA